jgi:hypothetical protein
MGTRTVGTAFAVVHYSSVYLLFYFAIDWFFLCEEPGYNFLLSNATRPMVEVRYTFYSDIGYAIRVSE